MSKKSMTLPFDGKKAKRAVIQVGPSGGRGFVMEIGSILGPAINRIVITAGHCLPNTYECFAALSGRVRSDRLIGPLGGTASVMSECLFVDPLSDLAVLTAADGQAIENADVEWESFMETVGSVDLSYDVPKYPDGMPRTEQRGWLLSLTGSWSSCKVAACTGELGNSVLWLEEASCGILGGMSGSPVLDDDGRAIGVLVIGESKLSETSSQGGPQPRLSHALPSWLVTALTRRSKQVQKKAALSSSPLPEPNRGIPPPHMLPDQLFKAKNGRYKPLSDFTEADFGFLYPHLRPKELAKRWAEHQSSVKARLKRED